MYTLVLLRHGQTTANKEKIFSGWTDAELTEQGIQEAKTSGKNLKEAGFKLDIAFTSLLKRAQETLNFALEEMHTQIPIEYTWRLNERHYGALQGEKHEEIAKKHSPEQVQIWRRSYDIRPPQLTHDDARHPHNHAKYDHIDREHLPAGESLEDTIARVLPYWLDEIVPEIKSGKKVIIAASGNSLRGLVKHMDGISNDDIVNLEIKNGTPLIYRLDKDLKPLEKYYLIDGGVKVPFGIAAKK